MASGEEEPDRCVQQLDPYQQGGSLGLRFHREPRLQRMDRFHWSTIPGVASLLAAGGWKQTRIVPTAALDSIVEAVPA